MNTQYPYTSVVRITDSLGQGSGVLITPDEVLTAAHVVSSTDYGKAMHIEATAGYDATGNFSSPISASAVHSEPIYDPNDTITPSESEHDFAVIHLSQPVLEAGAMELGSNYPGGFATITGYPVDSYPGQLNKMETLSIEPSSSALVGDSIVNGPGEPAGSSGGPVWAYASDLNQHPVVYGLVSGANYDDPEQTYGIFSRFTAADVSIISAWVAKDDKGESFPAITAWDINQLTPVIRGLRTDAEVVGESHPFIAARESAVANAIEDAFFVAPDVHTPADLVQLAADDLASSSPHPKLDEAYLEGFVYRAEEGQRGGVLEDLEARYPDLLASTPHAARAALAGFMEPDRVGMDGIFQAPPISAAWAATLGGPAYGSFVHPQIALPTHP